MKRVQNDQLKILNGKRGYTLLFAVLASVVVLGVGAFIAGASRKQFILSSSARESTYAIYAADSGIECASAAYYLGKFGSSTAVTGEPTNTFACHGDTVTLSKVDSPVAPGLTQIVQWVGTSTMATGCSVIVFTTGLQEEYPLTRIESRGYNICKNGEPDSTNPQSVERALRLTYGGVW